MLSDPCLNITEDDNKKPAGDTLPVYCYRCNGRWHGSANCPTRKCYLCGRHGHQARNCKSIVPRSRGQNKNSNSGQRNQVSAGCLVQSSPLQAMAEDIQSCIEGDQLLLACGKKIPSLSSACVQPLSGARSEMPVVKGKTLKVASSSKNAIVDRNELMRLQHEDKRLEKYWDKETLR